MSLKLAYFGDNKGRNELTRLIFAVGHVPYQDESIGWKEFQTMRNDGTLPWGQLPVLTVDGEEGGEMFGQSCAIARYAAQRAHLYPTKSELDVLRSDGVVDSWRDTLDLYYDTVFARRIIGGRMQMFPHPPSERRGRLDALLATELTEQFGRYERLLAPTGRVCSDEGMFPCWADLAIYDLVKTMKGALTDAQFARLFDGKSKVISLVERVDNIDEIKAHLKEHPYKDVKEFFEYPPLWKRLVHATMFPFVQFVMGLRNRYRAFITDKPKEV